MAAPARPWRAALIGVIAGVALPLPAMTAPALAAPGGPADDKTARAVATKVAAAVRTQAETEGKSTFWVVLDKQADLSTAQTKATKAEKAAEVYRSKTEFAAASQAGLRKLLDQHKVDYTPFWISNRIQVTAGAKLLGEIATRNDVARVEADTRIEIPKPIVNPKPLAEVNGVEWGIDRINAPRVWNELGIRGEDIVVANIDTGVNWEHPALADKYRGKKADGTVSHDYNWFDPTRLCPAGTPCDNNDHGSHTMGTMVGDEGTNQIGVAPRAKWIAAKGCETSGCSSASLLASGQWVVAPTNLAGANPRPDLAPDVVSNSWGSNTFDAWYTDIVNSWIAAGIFPSFANGNNGRVGCNTSGSPGNYTISYASGAFDINNAIADFSSKGPGQGGTVKPDIAAPGVNVRSSTRTGYGSFSGTSMAAPHTSAVVALMWSASPTLRGDVAETKRLLDSTAIDVDNTTCGGTPAKNNVFGEGRIDAFAAVQATPRGPLGALGGTITSGGQPLAGASVTADGPIDRTVSTGADGKYSFPRLSVGEYTVKASKYGFITAAGTATVTENGTTTLNLTLVQAPSATLSGTVRTSTGPTADATVELLGTPLAAKTDAQGRYSVVAPTGEYDVKMTSPARCAESVTRHVSLTSDTTLDVALPDRVDGYGYACGGPADGGYPTVTSKLDLAGDDVTKPITLPFAVPLYGTTYTSATVSTNGNLTFGAASITGVNEPIPAPGTPNGALYPFWDDLRIDDQAGIYTGVVGVSPHRAFVVEWRNVAHYSDATQRLSFTLSISEDGSVVYRYKEVSGNGLEAGSSASIGLENATGTLGYSYSFNTPTVTDGLALAFRTTKSGVVRGTVTDANDNQGVAGAKVTVKNGDTVVGAAVTGADGSYLVQAGAGDVSVVVEAANYEPKTRPAAITAGSVVSVSTSLRTARVLALPTALEVVVPRNEARTRTIELANTGGLDTPFTVSEAGGDVPWLAFVGGSGALQPGGKTKLTITVSAAGLEKGTFHNAELLITSASGRNPALRVPVRIVVPGFRFSIDAGSERVHTDAQGDTWRKDTAHKKGSCGYLGTSTTVTTTKPIKNTYDPARLADAREGMYEYRCDRVADGVYTVELDFAELRNTKPNKRVFDVLIEGTEVLPSLDIALEAGTFAATSRTYTVRVTDGQLNVRFVTHSGFGKPIVNAFRVTHRPDKAM